MCDDLSILINELFRNFAAEINIDLMLGTNLQELSYQYVDVVAGRR